MSPDVVDSVKWWIQNYVLGLNLCPFAVKPYSDGKIVYKTCSNLTLGEISRFLQQYISVDIFQYSTSLLISERELSFNDFLDLFYYLEDLITDGELGEVIKLVGFHPEYCHRDGSKPYLYFSNRAPFPIIQLISVQESLKDIHSETVNRVLENNDKTLKNIGVQDLNILLHAKK